MNSKAEQIRIRHLYRRMILNGEIKVHRHTARRLIGPDCAFHLYGRHIPASEVKNKKKDRNKS